MAKYLVCVSDERHASYEIERAILEKAGAEPVSYTHLDVYKRQPLHSAGAVAAHELGHVGNIHAVEVADDRVLQACLLYTSITYCMIFLVNFSMPVPAFYHFESCRINLISPFIPNESPNTCLLYTSELHHNLQSGTLRRHIEGRLRAFEGRTP